MTETKRFHDAQIETVDREALSDAIGSILTMSPHKAAQSAATRAPVPVSGPALAPAFEAAGILVTNVRR